MIIIVLMILMAVAVYYSYIIRTDILCKFLLSKASRLFTYLCNLYFYSDFDNVHFIVLCLIVFH